MPGVCSGLILELMVWLRTMMLLAGTLSVLVLGVPAQAASNAPPPPCHQAMADHGQPVEHHEPDKTMKSMACCVVCVAGFALPAAGPNAAPRTAPPAISALLTLPTGRSPAPEHGPPRA